MGDPMLARVGKLLDQFCPEPRQRTTLSTGRDAPTRRVDSEDRKIGASLRAHREQLERDAEAKRRFLTLKLTSQMRAKDDALLDAHESVRRELLKRDADAKRHLLELELASQLRAKDEALLQAKTAIGVLRKQYIGMKKEADSWHLVADGAKGQVVELRVAHEKETRAAARDRAAILERAELAEARLENALNDLNVLKRQLEAAKKQAEDLADRRATDVRREVEEAAKRARKAAVAAGAKRRVELDQLLDGFERADTILAAHETILRAGFDRLQKGGAGKA
jgi:hypothetical protein